MRARVFAVAHLPEELVKPWLQHMRDFDTAHPGCHFEIAITANSDTLDAVEALKLDPPFNFTMVIPTDQKKTAP